MKISAVIIGWICVIVTGVFLRSDDLGKRPFHADEATGARITAKRMEGNGGSFNPKHFHGPLLADLVIPICRIRGENHWSEMTKTTLRMLPVIAGVLLIGLPLFWRRRFGDLPMLISAAFLATSPLLVYYSRMFIHESLLVLFGISALLAFTGKPRWAVSGILLGLMFATKESFAISVIAWIGAGLWIAVENRKSLDRSILIQAWREYRISIVVTLLIAGITAGIFYTDWLRYPQGAVDAVRTFFVYETVNGHDKSLGYYLQLLAIPKKSGGVWWFETPILVCALIAYASTFVRCPGGGDGMRKNTIRFLAYAALGHFIIYTIIAYKTPWLACLPWAHVCLLAGFSATIFINRGFYMTLLFVSMILAGLTTQIWQSKMASGRYASDVRNPYAYVPTQRDVESLESWFQKLRKVVPDGAVEPIAIVGSDYWPLPWYLRSFEKIGYWPTPPDDLKEMSLVFSSGESTVDVMRVLENSHTALPRGLRADSPLILFVRNDLWNHWMEVNSK